MSDLIFEKNYLKQIIFKVDFRTIPELRGIDANPDKFVNIIKDEFSKPNDVVQENKIQFSSENPEIESIEKNNIWVFFNKSESKFIELTNSSIAISYNGEMYLSHNEIINDISLIIKALEEYNMPYINKIGLRYINEISPNVPITNWDSWINPILHNFNSMDDNLKLRRSLTNSEFEINGYNLDFTYGQFNSNYPSTEIINDFVLDYDCYTSSFTNINELTIKFEEMHEIIISLFKKSIGEDLIKDLKGEF